MLHSENFPDFLYATFGDVRDKDIILTRRNGQLQRFQWVSAIAFFLHHLANNSLQIGKIFSDRPGRNQGLKCFNSLARTQLLDVIE